LARRIAELVGSDKVDVVDVTSMKIFACEGNISRFIETEMTD
jgi:hypothetical protein